MKILQWTALILFFIFVALLATHSLNSINQDIGRHLKSGQIIWETGQVYKTNLFSFTEQNQPFINHHWLSEVVFYLLNSLIGLKGLIIFKALALASAFLLIWLGLRPAPSDAGSNKTVSSWAFGVAGIFGSFILLSRSDVRPEIFSYLFLAFFLFAIFRAKYGAKTKWLYVLPIAQILWTNFHIYFALGPALLLFLLIDRLAHRKDQAKLIFKIFAVTSLAILLNPNFLKGALAPLTILREYGYSIVENQSIFFLQNYGVQLKDIYLFEISLIILVISFVIAVKNGRRNITFEALAAAAFVIMAGKMIRNFGPYAFVFTAITAINLSAYRPVFLNKKAAVLILGIFLAGSNIFLIKNVPNNNIYKWLGSYKSFGTIVPSGAEQAVQFVKENDIRGPVFNNFDVGSFLIWKRFPEEKVFVDGRPEAYSVEFFEKIYKPMQEDPAVWKSLSEEYRINYVFFAHTDMTPWARAFLSHISQNPDWPLVYLDGSVAIFIKRTPENRELIREFEIKI